MISATVGDVRIICIYVPNGQSLESEKYKYKLEWLDSLYDWIRDEFKRYPKLVLLGDYNIALEDRDVHSPADWEGKNLVSPIERAAFTRLKGLKLTDAFRMFPQKEKLFSWWDYRRMGFRLNHGMRIDYILLSPLLAAGCVACMIDKLPRSWEQPSDHAPVLAILS
jgi:exodeoxyribonuclease-3